jgi:hypothetical protein
MPDKSGSTLALADAVNKLGQPDQGLVLAVPVEAPPPEPLLSLLDGAVLAGALAGVPLVAGEAAPPDLPDDDAASAPVAGAPLLPPRKSVTYQPEPLSWKPAAVTCFLKVSAPQAGQVLSTGSDIF